MNAPSSAPASGFQASKSRKRPTTRAGEAVACSNRSVVSGTSSGGYARAGRGARGGGKAVQVPGFLGGEVQLAGDGVEDRGRMATVGLSAPALAGHVTAGALRPVVHSVYPLADIGAAHEAFERGGVLGKHVLAVSG